MAEESEKQVRITYETLYELLRREKSNDELQNLDESFFMDVAEYLSEKNKILQDAAGKFDMFSIDERDNTQVQLNNVRRIIRELYERREKKIIEMALNKSRTKSNIIDTAHLIGKEKTLYEEMIQLFDGFRKEILFALLEMRAPEPIAEPKPEKEQAACTEKEIPAASSTGQEQELKITKKIKFTQKVDEFIGPDLEVMGPFEPEHIEELPAEIADVLVNQGNAVIVQ